MVSQEGREINSFYSLPVQLRVVISVTMAQCLLILAVGLWGAQQMISGNISSVSTGVTLFGIITAMVIWSVNIGLGLLRLKPWSRTAAVVLQLIFISIGVASFGGEFGNFFIGALLLVPATFALFLLFGRRIGVLFSRD